MPAASSGKLPRRSRFPLYSRVQEIRVEYGLTFAHNVKSQRLEVICERQLTAIRKEQLISSTQNASSSRLVEECESQMPIKKIEKLTSAKRRPNIRERVDFAVKLFPKVLTTREEGGKASRSRSTPSANANQVAEILAAAIEVAFDRAELDIDNETHRLVMLACLAWGRYGKAKRKPGHPEKWTAMQRESLMSLYYEMKESRPKWSDERISKDLRSKAEFADIKASTIRRRIAKEKLMARLKAE